MVTNAAQREVVLRVNGFIVPDPNKLRKHIGKLRMNRAEVNFGTILDTATKYDSILVRNDSNHIMNLEFNLAEKPWNIDISIDNNELEPGEITLIKASFTGDKEGKYGFSRFRINFTDVDFPLETKGQLIISYSQQEDFKSWSNEQKANAPRLKFFNKTVKFSEVVMGEQVECEYRFENTGKSVLKIRDIRLPSHVSILRYDENTEPGEEGSIVLSVDTTRMTGDLIRYVNITTNSRTVARVRLTIEGEIDG